MVGVSALAAAGATSRAVGRAGRGATGPLTTAIAVAFASLSVSALGTLPEAVTASAIATACLSSRTTAGASPGASASGGRRGSTTAVSTTSSTGTVPQPPEAGPARAASMPYADAGPPSRAVSRCPPCRGASMAASTLAAVAGGVVLTAWSTGGAAVSVATPASVPGGRALRGGTTWAEACPGPVPEA